MKDLNGRTYAKLSDCKPGVKLQADGDFPCIKDRAILTIKAREDGQLYVPCMAIGGHNLDGQLDDDTLEYLIGLYPVE